MNRNGIRLRRYAVAILLAMAGELAAAQSIQNDKEDETRAVDFHALIEVEAFSGGNEDSAGSSDISLATVELTVLARVDEWSRARLVYLFEQDDTEPGEIDQAVLSLGNRIRTPFHLSLGRMYVPFGSFESAMISDPLTLELGETRESALEAGYLSSGLRASLYVFNGESREIGESDKIMDYGASVSYATDAAAVGVDYISSISDSDAGRESIVNVDALSRRVGGVSAHAAVQTHALSVTGEYLGSIHRFAATDLAFSGKGAKPAAWNLELDYGLTLFGRAADLAVARQGTSDALGLGLSKRKTLAALDVALSDAVVLSVEYAVTRDYGASDGGAGNSTSTFTVQLAAEF